MAVRNRRTAQQQAVNASAQSLIEGGRGTSCASSSLVIQFQPLAVAVDQYGEYFCNSG